MYSYSSTGVVSLMLNKWRIETGQGMMMYRYGSRTGFLSVLVPSVSVNDRAVVDPADHV